MFLTSLLHKNDALPYLVNASFIKRWIRIMVNEFCFKQAGAAGCED